MTSSPAPKRREREIQRSILVMLRALGVPAWKSGSGAFRGTYKGRERFVRMGVTGLADIIGVVPPSGRVIAIEVKSQTGTVTLAQQAFLQSVRAAGGLAIVAKSIDDVMEALGCTT